jgi:hypothetical protein
VEKKLLMADKAAIQADVSIAGEAPVFSQLLVFAQANIKVNAMFSVF